MEDILDLCYQPRDPARPLLCVDELPVQFFAEVAAWLPAKPGTPAKQDYEYVRNGSGSLFIAFAPLEGKRLTYVSAGATRTSRDYAEFMRTISGEWFPEADSITVVQDNLSTHSNGAFYSAFPAMRLLSLNHKKPRTPFGMRGCESFSVAAYWGNIGIEFHGVGHTQTFAASLRSWPTIMS